MSNFLVWFGFSLIIKCLNNQGAEIGDSSLIHAWGIIGLLFAIIDVTRLVVWVWGKNKT